MSALQPQSAQTIAYPDRTVRRADRALRCSPFQLPLWTAMRSTSVSLQAIAAEVGVQNHYTQHPIPELAAENELLWLIQVGVLRREVDGQGLTDSFRLTPLGRQITEQWQSQNYAAIVASWLDHLYNLYNRFVRLPL